MIPIQFEDVEEFKKGRARVKVGGRWKYINKQAASKRQVLQKPYVISRPTVQ